MDRGLWEVRGKKMTLVVSQVLEYAGPGHGQKWCQMNSGTQADLSLLLDSCLASVVYHTLKNLRNLSHLSQLPVG